jgi:hypothetical protein
MSSWDRFFHIHIWKVSTLLLAAALAFVLVDNGVQSAEAAGPKNLGKALSALKSTKKFLEDAKDPPAPFHAQSLALVNTTIGAVEREIKAYEDAAAKAKAAGATTTAKTTPKPGEKKADKPKAAAPKHSAPGNNEELFNAVAWDLLLAKLGPFAVEHAKDQRIGPDFVAEEVLSQQTFANEAELLCDTNRGLVAWVDINEHPMQLQVGEDGVDKEHASLGDQALSLEIPMDCVPELRLAMLELETNAHATDQAIVSRRARRTRHESEVETRARQLVYRRHASPEVVDACLTRTSASRHETHCLGITLVRADRIEIVVDEFSKEQSLRRELHRCSEERIS